jgi:serine/threonine protein kinase
MPRSLSLSAGAVIGCYVLSESIGSGAFASVWRAHPVACPIVSVAIKIIPRENVATPLARKRLAREVALLQKLRHPFIAEFFEAIDDGALGCFCLVMEFVSHGNLLEHVKVHGHLGEDEARLYFAQLVWVLDYLHREMQVAHRDLKCENILLDHNNNIRLIDFGLSHQFSEQHPELRTACGSPAYAAPEIIVGKLYTRMADIWSVGILLYVMVAGRFPFEDSNIQRIFKKIVESEPVWPSELSPPLADLLGKLLAKDPDRRISLEGVKAHPWFSQTEYNAMVQLTREEVEHWRTIRGVATEETIDREVIGILHRAGIDCRRLEEDLLLDDGTRENPSLVIYRIMRRKRITDGMRDLMERAVMSGGGFAETTAVQLYPRSASMVPPIVTVSQKRRMFGPPIVLPGGRKPTGSVIMRRMTEAPVLPPVPNFSETPWETPVETE